MKIIMRQEVDIKGHPLPLEFLGKKLGAHCSPLQMMTLWQQTMDSLKLAMESAIPDISVHMPRLGEIDKTKKQLLDELEGFVVSMDSYDTTGSFELQVSRHFMPRGKQQCILPLGRRPGSIALDQQIKQVVVAAKGQPILLVDDDTFTGGTAAHIITLLRAAGLEVNVFMVGTQAEDTKNILGVPIVAIEKDPDVFDIVDPRDLLFGMKDGGLVINNKNVLSRVPWIWPWVDLHARCGMPESAQRKFSTEITKLNMKLFTNLEKIFETSILVEDMDQPFQDFVSEYTDFGTTMRMTDFCSATKNLILNTVNIK